MSKLVQVINDNEYKAAPLKYYKRVVQSFKSTIVFYAIFFLGIGVMSSFSNAFYIVLFFFLLNLIEYSSWSRYYVTHIEKTDGELRVEYYDRDELKILSDNASSFSFEVKNVWYKVRGYTPYLVIRHADRNVARQFLINDINESVIKKISVIGQN